jgi:FAD/FMN-containing dehydrogenase
MPSETRSPADLDAVVDELRSKLTGAVIGADDPGYIEARKVWNGMFDDRLPKAVLRCADEDDVRTAAKLLAGVDVPVAVRGGGHHIAGFGTCDGGFVIDLLNLRWATVDPGAGRISCGGGATLHELDVAGAEAGLAAPLGVVSETGVAGLVLSGGVGWQTRRHGYTCDNLRRARLVTATGEVVEASEHENRDLLWGLKGGGGNFGIVTEFEFDAFPLERVLVTDAYHLPRDEREVEALLRFYRESSGELSNDVSISIMATTGGSEFEGVLPEAVGRLTIKVRACSLDCSDRGFAALMPIAKFGAPALTRTGPMRFVDLQHSGDKSNSAEAGKRRYMKGEMLVGITDEMIAGMADRCAALPSPGSVFEMQTLGGAMSDHDEMHAAVGMRAANHLAGFNTQAAPDEDLETVVDWTRQAWSVLRAGSAGGTYLNFDGEADAARVLGSLGVGEDASKADRLQALKRSYDPGNRFRVNHNIEP